MALADVLARLRRGEARPLLEPFIETVVDHWRHAPSFRRKGVWHPSQAHNACPRAEVIKRLLPKSVNATDWFPDTKLFRILRVGHWLHRGYQEEYLGPTGKFLGRWRCSRCHHEVVGPMPDGACSECQWQRNGTNLTSSACHRFCSSESEGYEPDPEKQVERGGCITCSQWGRWEYREFRVRLEVKVGDTVEVIYGHIDGIIIDDSTGEVVFVIVDIKTINPRTFTEAGITPKYRDQLMLYLGCSASIAKDYPELGLPEDGIKRGRILYLNKSPQRDQKTERELELVFDQAEFDELLESPKRVAAAFDTQELPEKLEECSSRRSKRAKGCSVCNACFESESFRQVELRTVA